MTTNWKKPAAITAVVLALGGLGYATLTSRKPAPAVTFHAISGEQIGPENLRGKVVLVYFWATSCTTCVREMPQMVSTYQQFQSQGLEMVAVAMSYDRPDYVLNYAQTRKLPFKVALDVDGAAAKAYGNVALTPTTFVIGKDGTILKRYVGEPKFDELHKLLAHALAS
jgi:peroxiredoxin